MTFFWWRGSILWHEKFPKVALERFRKMKNDNLESYRLKFSKNSCAAVDSLSISETTTFRIMLPIKAKPKEVKKDF